jgi:hypothetical protein
MFTEKSTKRPRHDAKRLLVARQFEGLLLFGAFVQGVVQ